MAPFDAIVHNPTNDKNSRNQQCIMHVIETMRKKLRSSTIWSPVWSNENVHP